MSDNKSLVVGAQQHLTTQVKTANIQLLISSQLMQDVERRRFVEILKSIGSVRAVEFLSRRACLNEELLERFKDKWNWHELSVNEALPWSLALIEQFKDKWDWSVFCDTAVACLPKLSLQDIDEVMSYHFPLKNKQS